MEARQIAMEAGMNSRPEFYSGRGAISCDLNQRHLEKIHAAILGDRGKDAAAAFVLMVADLPSLSATDFLVALYALESNEWSWEAALRPNTGGMYATDEFVALATVAEVLAGSGRRDETDKIRHWFLLAHEDELPKDVANLLKKQAYRMDQHSVARSRKPGDAFRSYDDYFRGADDEL